MHFLGYVLEHGCSGKRMLSNMDVIMVLGMDAQVKVYSPTPMLLWFGHGCSGQRMLSNTDLIVVWAWMLWSTYALEHGCHYGLGMDALVNVCTKTLKM